MNIKELLTIRNELVHSINEELNTILLNDKINPIIAYTISLFPNMRQLDYKKFEDEIKKYIDEIYDNHNSLIIMDILLNHYFSNLSEDIDVFTIRLVNDILRKIGEEYNVE